MKLKVILHSRKSIIFVATILILLLAYIVFKLTFPGADPLIKFFSYLTGPYLFLVEKFTNIILQSQGSTLSILNHGIALNGMPMEGFVTQIMYKKVTIFYILILLLTRSTLWKKICFTGIYLVLNFLSASSYIVAGAYSIAGDPDNGSIISITHGIVFLCMNTTMLIWYLLNKRSWSDSPSSISVVIKIIEKKIPDIIIILYAFLIVKFSLAYFDFSLYINLLLKSSQGIVGLFGYESEMGPALLTGYNGSVYVDKGCMGFMTMFLFSAMVYLTGNKHHRGWTYIIIGLLILNFLNILRIVLLFIHIQKHGDYMLAIDHHDLYQYIFYLIIFILWVIWFERLIELKTLKSIKSFLKL